MVDSGALLVVLLLGLAPVAWRLLRRAGRWTWRLAMAGGVAVGVWGLALPLQYIGPAFADVTSRERLLGLLWGLVCGAVVGANVGGGLGMVADNTRRARIWTLAGVLPGLAAVGLVIARAAGGPPPADEPYANLAQADWLYDVLFYAAACGLATFVGAWLGEWESSPPDSRVRRSQCT